MEESEETKVVQNNVQSETLARDTVEESLASIVMKTLDSHAAAMAKMMDTQLGRI
jgi:hypothetical protein